MDMNLLLFNNRIYGMTKGQFSPCTFRGSDLVDYVESLCNFAEDGVLTVKVQAAVLVVNDVELRSG